MPNALLPRQPVPALELPVVGGGTWRLGAHKPANFTLLVFYRGLHCPICGRYLADLESKVDAFAERGVDVVTVSSDTAERAVEARAKWKLAKTPVAYGLTLDQARAWGLFLSRSRGKTSVGIDEPAIFSEPGLFLVRPDGTLYFGTVQTMPFARPNFAEILQALDFVIKNNYPARGEIADHRTEAAA